MNLRFLATCYHVFSYAAKMDEPIDETKNKKININDEIDKMENEINKIEQIYKITKGFCLIINIINFDGNEELKREGSEENVKLIKEAFKYHQFEVNDYCDLNDYQIINLIDEQVNHEKCKSFDAFVLYIHTHGIQDTILCKNSYEKDENNKNILTKQIHFHQIIELFKGKNCEYLKHKPKIIFFDCCRNGKSNYINHFK